MTPKPKRGPGRPPKPMPERIPDTPGNVARAVLNTPPKKQEHWKYLQPEAQAWLAVDKKGKDGDRHLITWRG